jgi:hypothetical protein
MNSNHYRALTIRTLAAICLTALLVAVSQAQTEAALKNDKDGSGVCGGSDQKNEMSVRRLCWFCPV